MSLSTEIFQVDLKSENFYKNYWIILEENLKTMKKEIQPDADEPTAQKKNEVLEICK
jgi:hypothetical protein